MKEGPSGPMETFDDLKQFERRELGPDHDRDELGAWERFLSPPFLSLLSRARRRANRKLNSFVKMFLCEL